MDQESEGTSVMIFVVGGVVLLLLLLGGAAFFLFPGWQEDSARREVEAAPGPSLKELGRAVHDFKPDDRDVFIFPVEDEKTQNPGWLDGWLDGEANTLQNIPEPKSKKQDLPKGPGEPPVPKK